MSDQEQIITAPCGDCIEGSRIDGDRAIKCRNGIVPMCAHVALKDRNAALEQMATDAVFAGAKHKQEAERLEKELDTQRQGFERLNIEQANEIEGLKKELVEAKDSADSWAKVAKYQAEKRDSAMAERNKLQAENARLSMVLAEAKEYVEIATRFLKYQKPGKEFYPNKEGAEGCLGRIHDALDRAIVSNNEQ